MTENRSEKFVWFGPSPIEPFNSGKESSLGVDYLAKKYKVDIGQMMKIKKKFDEFDVDGSGEIDPEEFKAMIVFFLKVKDISDLPAARVQRFWAEIDVDQSGQVSFAEFVGWSRRAA